MAADPLSVIYPQHAQRAAFRVVCPGLRAELHPDGEFYLIKDLSACGLAILDKQARAQALVPGAKASISIWYKDRKAIHGLPVEVIRRNGDLVALRYDGLTLRQESFLDKLVLEIQKREIDRRKQAGSQKREHPTHPQKT
ncbi:MAG: PilZ domain-containing protein [Deltaproteobacteria bacterium]|nr:PilZ domain-containing protein [Deltaproteobacteria bacterium]